MKSRICNMVLEGLFMEVNLRWCKISCGGKTPVFLYRLAGEGKRTTNLDNHLLRLSCEPFTVYMAKMSDADQSRQH